MAPFVRLQATLKDNNAPVREWLVEAAVRLLKELKP